MKKKTKQKKVSGKSSQRVRKFQSHYLVFILIGFLVLEGFLITSTSSTDWQEGAAVLDVGSSISQSFSDLAQVLQPVADTVNGTTEFYQESATQMAQILDLSDSDVIGQVRLVTDGVSDFYQQSASQLAELLVAPSNNSYTGNIAGASIIAQ